MTKAQQKRLETILAKLEALQNEVSNDRVREYLGDGKSDLLRALRTA
tara:strand:- start:429 stop:569 length:141 start_codon:yes stop_codon:yes gene_type:complete